MTSLARRIAPAAGALLVYAFVVPWICRPWFLATDQIPHTPGPVGGMIDADLYLNIWILAWVAHAIVVAPLQLLHGNIFHPAPATIAGSENMLAHVIFTAPVLAYAGSALTMLKAYVLESFALSGLGMFLYVQHHTRSSWAALVAGAAYTLTPFRVETIPQPQYLGIAFLPLALLAIDLHLETEKRRWLAGFAVALVLQALACVYVGFFAFILCPVYVLARSIPLAANRTGWVAPTARLAASMVVAAVILLPAALPYLRGRGQGMIPEHDLHVIQMAAWSPWLYLTREFVWRAGVVAVAVVGLDLVLRAWRRLATRATSPGIDWRSPTAALWIVIAVASILAAGPYLPLPGGILVPLPYVALYEIVPGFSSIRVPIRFVIVVSAAFAAIAGFVFARVTRGRPPRWVAAAGLALTALAVFGAAPRPHPVMAARLQDADTGVYRWLAAQPGPGAVLEIPGQSTEQDVVGNLRNGRYMVASTIHWRPLLNGYTAYPPPSAAFYSAAIRDLPEPDALALLVETSDLRWIVLHRGELTPLEDARWPASTPSGLELVARFGADEIYEVTLERAREWRDTIEDRMAGITDDTLQGASLEPLPPPCRSGRITDAAVPERIPPFPLARRVPVRIRNDSNCSWPALGLLEKGLVGLDYRWIPPDGAPEVDQVPVPLFRLLSDVAPGGEARGAIMLTPPKGGPGIWTLEVRLRQQGAEEPIATIRRPIEVRAPKRR